MSAKDFKQKGYGKNVALTANPLYKYAKHLHFHIDIMYLLYLFAGVCAKGEAH
jgi:hypothetical protein